MVFDLTELDSWILDNGDDSVLRSEVATLGQVQPVTRPQVSLDVLHFRVVGMRFGQCLRKFQRRLCQGVRWPKNSPSRASTSEVGIELLSSCSAIVPVC